MDAHLVTENQKILVLLLLKMAQLHWLMALLDNLKYIIIKTF